MILMHVKIKHKNLIENFNIDKIRRFSSVGAYRKVYTAQWLSMYYKKKLYYLLIHYLGL
jgi:hypothetical protein